MIAFNIFKWIGELFTEILFIPFDLLRKGDFSWWVNNIVNWVFLFILLALFYYWMKESRRFIKEGTEDFSK
ncbi:MAG: hypothetical protein GKR88_03245 [Flavobacteriaceae bacterium]|nr:MAG: hypothetical protein GKR88_03245 [Flavobacteriaceae bacterium]